MKKHLLLIGLVVSAFGFGSSVSAQPERSGLTLDSGVTAHRGLDDVYRRFSEGYRRLDPVLVAGLYTGSAAYLVPGDNVMVGREKILASFTSFFDSVKKQNGKLEISFQILQRQAEKNMAYDVGIYTLRSTGANGETRTGQGKFVVVATRAKDDVWRFQVDGYSDLPSQPK